MALPPSRTVFLGTHPKREKEKDAVACRVLEKQGSYSRTSDGREVRVVDWSEPASIA